MPKGLAVERREKHTETEYGRLENTSLRAPRRVECCMIVSVPEATLERRYLSYLRLS
jgi:hypothetical protein